MIIKASHESVTNLVNVTIFGTTIIILYAMSCIYHALSPHIIGKKILRVFDHTNVFLLVLGAILPVALIGIGVMQGYFFFGLVSLVTLVGIFVSCVNIDKVQWTISFMSFNEWLERFIFNKAYWSYTSFTHYIRWCHVFFLYGVGSKKKYMYCIFHFFCIFGTIFHFIAIYGYLI